MIFDWTWEAPQRVHLIWLAIAIVGGLFALELRTRDAMATFLSPAMQRRLTASASFGRVILRLALVLAAMIAGVLALMRPQLRGETDEVTVSSGNADVMFVLDTSRSMLADDAKPTRLAKAKSEISRLIDKPDKLANPRVGLVAFAGRAVQMCPLTPDYSFFNTVLNTVDTRSAGKGGSRVGDALHAALRGFPPGQGAKLIVLITDGDDQDPYTEDAAKAVRDAGVKIVAIGIGDPAGSEIDLVDPVTHAKQKLLDKTGKPVISKLDSAMLGKIAVITEGAYIPAGTAALDLEAIMQQHVTPLLTAANAQVKRQIPVEEYTWLVMIALGCLLASLWVAAGAGDRRDA